MYERFGLYIDGAWRRGTAHDAVISPVTEKPIGNAPSATPKDTVEALDAAERALKSLSDMGGFGRADALHRVADAMVARAEEAATMISTETGKPIAQSRREWGL